MQASAVASKALRPAGAPPLPFGENESESAQPLSAAAAAEAAAEAVRAFEAGLSRCAADAEAAQWAQHALLADAGADGGLPRVPQWAVMGESGGTGIAFPSDYWAGPRAVERALDSLPPLGLLPSTEAPAEGEGDDLE